MAGECGYRSMLVALGTTHGARPSCEVLHYEAPFGVGYLVAQLMRGRAATRRKVNRQEQLEDTGQEMEPSGEENLPALARRAVENFIREERLIEKPRALSALLTKRAACFVSIKTLEGDLRGCIGTLEPVKETLAEELIANAISAATRDPRFPPVTSPELPHLRYSVDVLSEPEPTRFEELDPVLYGVIVEDEGGTRRGLLLPNLEGIESVSQQVDIAARKAGIAPGSPLKLSRFRAERFYESAQLNYHNRTKEHTHGRR